MLEFNGKKVTKIMLGDKEIMSSGGLDINEWISQIDKDKKIFYSNGKIQGASGYNIYPPISIPPDKSKATAVGAGFNFVMAFYDSNSKFLKGKDGAASEIPNGAKTLKYSYGQPVIINFS